MSISIALGVNVMDTQFLKKTQELTDVKEVVK